MARVRDPFPLTQTRNLSSDGSTRLLLLAQHLNLLPGENSSLLTAEVYDGY